MKKKTFKFNAKFSDVEEITNDVSKVKIRVMHTNGNVNGSYISKETMENKFIPTIANKPIVGHFKEEVDNFGEHDSQIVISNDKSIEFIDLTKPYGVINENCETWWEEIEEDGEIHEYFCCTGLLWTGRYPEANSIIKNGMNQSMEIDVFDGYKSKDGYYHITDGQFSAFCILGKSEDEEINKTPCFPSANIEEYSMNFKAEFNDMIKEFKNIMKDYSKKEREVDNMDKKKKFSLSVNQIENAIRKVLRKETTVEKDYWGEAYESPKYYMIDILQEENIVIVMDNITWDDYYGISFKMNGDVAELDFENKKPYVRGDWREKQEGDTNLEVFSKLKSNFKEQIEKSYQKQIEKEKSNFKAENTKEYKVLEQKLKETQEKFANNNSNKDIASLENDLQEAKNKLKTKENEYSKLEGELKDMKNLEQEVEELKKFKNQKEQEEKEMKIEEIVSKFSFKEEDIAELKEKAIKGEFSVGEFEEKLFVLEGKKSLKEKNNFSKTNNSFNEGARIKVHSTQSNKEQECVYGDLSKYFED